MAEKITKKMVLGVLKNVNDPEVPVSVVDLGMIYDVSVEGRKVHIKMTLTNPGCPMGQHIMDSVKEEVKSKLNVDVEVELVFDPPWNPDMMSKEAKKQLGFD